MEYYRRLNEFTELPAPDLGRCIEITGEIADSGKSELDLPAHNQNPVLRSFIECGGYLLLFPVGNLPEDIERN